jgi:hypothetical protein
MAQLEQFVTSHSLNIIVLAFIIITLVGILKFFGVFSKITNADLRKFIYLVVDISLSFGLGALYIVIFKLDWLTYIPLVMELIPAVLVGYAIYENVGGRKFIKFIGNFIVNVVAKSYIDKEVEKLKQEKDTK